MEATTERKSEASQADSQPGLAPAPAGGGAARQPLKGLGYEAGAAQLSPRRGPAAPLREPRS